MKVFKPDIKNQKPDPNLLQYAAERQNIPAQASASLKKGETPLLRTHPKTCLTDYRKVMCENDKVKDSYNVHKPHGI